MNEATPWPGIEPCWQGGVLRRRGNDDGPPVVKIGGSLLARPAWPAWLQSLVALPACRGGLLVVGGGPIVDGIRAIDAAARALPPSLSHGIAIDAMNLTGRLVADTIGAPIESEPRTVSEAVSVLDVSAWLRMAGHANLVPAGWHVTSDSIAAAVASVLSRRLLLVKSVPPPIDEGDRVAACVAAGWLDPYFPEAASRLETIGWLAPG